MIKIIFISFVIAVTFCGCKKNFDVNQYGNQPSDILPSFLLSAGLNQTATNNATNYLGLTRWMGYWARGGEYPPDVQTETYDIKNSYTDSEWTRLYQNLSTYDLLEKTATDLKLPFYIGAAKLMKAYCFSTLVDLYNDVPYKQAFGKTTSNQPTYDNAQEIYNDLVPQLDSAFIYFENARVYYQNHPAGIAISNDQFDIMYGSAKSKAAGYNDRLTLWEKLTNTLELKLLMHQSEVGNQQSFIQTKINALTTFKERRAAGFIEAGESATVNPGYQQKPGMMNPLLALFFNTDGSSTKNFEYYRANNYAESFFHKGNDFRGYRTTAVAFYPCGRCTNGYFSYFPIESILSTDPLYKECSYGCSTDTGYVVNEKDDTVFLYNNTNGPVVVVYHSDTIPSHDIVGGNYDGDPAALPFILTDDITVSFFKKFNQDQFIFSDFESLFLQAEAVQSGYLAGNAQTLYESAITQNYFYVVNSDIVVATEYAKRYFKQSITDIGWSASANKLEAILTQKWAAMNGINWVEAYNDYRRTGYPTSKVLGISHAPTHLQPMIPVRFLYPQSELNNNGAHVPQLGTNAQFTAKVFWDK